jgi:tetratricopeptide (TPR) repeat protein
MSKPMVVTLPAVLILLDVWPLGRVRLERGQSKQWLKLVYEKIPFLAVAAAAAAVTIWASIRKGGVTSVGALPLMQRFTNATVSYAAYIRDMFWPANLAPFYPYQSYAAWIVALSLVVLIAVTAFTVFSARSRPYLLIGWLWYVVMLAPVSGIIQAGSQSRADRFTYVPLVGLFIMIAWGVPELLAHWRYRDIALSVAAALLVCACAVLARQQAGYWENAFTLWQHALEATTGNYVAHTVLGSALADDRRVDEAIGHYREALALQPNFAEAHNGLAIALARQGRFDEAIAEFKAAVNLAPAAPLTHYDLGFALAASGKLNEAIEEYTEAVREDPEYIEALTKRGDAYQLQNRLDQAISDYNEALRIQPNFPDALNNLGLALAAQGKYDEAVARYNEALRVLPGFADAHNNLGSALTNQGKYSEAISEFNEALRLQPNNQLARENLAAVMELQKKGK